MFKTLKSLLFHRPPSDDQFQDEQARLLEHAPVPVFWMFGKTGSGKTSTVRYLTGAEDARIGSGYRPETRHSQRFDFPSEASPLLRFMDTRGLGESAYDPDEDIREFAQSTHLMIVTVRVMDHALESVLAPLRTIRKASPERPVVLALTCLHEAYPQQQHPEVDPFDDQLIPETIPLDLQRSIRKQQDAFAGLVDRIVPIDLTKPEEGFDQPEFGGERLKQALLELLPAAFRQTLLQFDESMQSLRDMKERQAQPIILSHSMLAATAAAVPVPWVDIPSVMAIQSRMTYKLASIYGQSVDRNVVLKGAGLLGGRLLARMLTRESLKFIPYVGIAANATLAFAYTYATGRAICWYFGQVNSGQVPTEEQVSDIWREQLNQAAKLWQRTHETGNNHDGNDA
ncbi:MAG: GTPase family protein [Maioricimonas sp. JB045]